MQQWESTERFAIEAEIYDKKAETVLQQLDECNLIVDSKQFPFPNRLHVAFIQYALACLGDLEGKKLLDCGCGTGASAVFFAQKGAHVIGVDISKQNIRICQQRARVNKVEDHSEFNSGPIELLEYDDQNFDLIFGNQIVHHLDVEMACANLRRMLKQGGKAVFCEPAFLLGKQLHRVRNSKLGKRLIPHRADTPTERSLSVEHLQTMEQFFQKVHYQGFHCLTRLTNWIQFNETLLNKMCQFDAFILKKLPFTQRLSHFLVLELE